MYKYILIFALLFSCSSSKSLQKDERGANSKLPITINYLSPKPTSLIQTSFDVLLRQLGFELMTLNEGFALAQREMTNAIQGGVNDNSLRKVTDTKIFQVLSIRVYATEPNESSFKIDSIYWKTYLFPSNDTGRFFNKFYPVPGNKGNGMDDLKQFANVVYGS